MVSRLLASKMLCMLHTFSLPLPLPLPLPLILPLCVSLRLIEEPAWREPCMPRRAIYSTLSLVRSVGRYQKKASSLEYKGQYKTLCLWQSVSLKR